MIPKCFKWQDFEKVSLPRKSGHYSVHCFRENALQKFDAENTFPFVTQFDEMLGQHQIHYCHLKIACNHDIVLASNWMQSQTFLYSHIMWMKWNAITIFLLLLHASHVWNSSSSSCFLFSQCSRLQINQIVRKEWMEIEGIEAQEEANSNRVAWT